MSLRISLPFVVQAVLTFSLRDVCDKRVAFFFVKSSATTTFDPLSFHRFRMNASFAL